MSLLRPIIRMCAIGALRNRTWAETRVYDSDQTPLAEAVLGKTAAPYIVVYTDADDRLPMAAMEVYNGGRERSLQLALEIGVASAVRNVEGQIVIKFSATDEGMEFAVDMVETQAIAALIGDPTNPWAEMFKQCCLRITRMPSRRGGSGQGGTRFAARRTVLVLQTMHDIPPGYQVDDMHWARRFIALARSQPQLGVVDSATIIENMLAVRPHLPAWQQAQAWLGVGAQSALNLMVDAPLDLNDDEHPMTDITLSDDPWHDDLEAIDAQTGSPVTENPPRAIGEIP